MLKPFKRPTFVRPGEIAKRDPDGEPQPKRRRTSSDDDSPPTASTTACKPAKAHSQDGVRIPLSAILANSIPTVAPSLKDGSESYYNVLWRKPTNKKNKTWDSDGIVRVAGGFAFLQDVDGKVLGRSPSTGAPLLPGSPLRIGGREVEVESVLSKKEYLAGRHSLGGGSAPATNLSDDDEDSARQKFAKNKAAASTFIAPKIPNKPQFQPTAFRKPRSLNTSSSGTEPGDPPKLLNPAAPQSIASQKKWKNPLKNDTVQPKVESAIPQPRHAVDAPNALVMDRPLASDIPKGKQMIDVVVDPLLSDKLRDHQREGVKFLYNCVMGMQSKLGQGAILADDMGLGKTLQTIALIWTLLKQNPVYESQPVIRKALIVCPVTLIKNWRKEFRKWLGAERLGVFVAEDKKQRITDFTRGRSYSVMIIGYERLRSVYEELQKGHGIDLIVADEGHRLKTAQSKSAQAIQALSTPRRIILSGTPIQNDLGEFFSMVDFVNPGALGTAKSFSRNFEKPIEKSRQPGATEKEIEKGESRGEEIADTTNGFILRRTADILSKYLPAKTESILLCKPTRAQATVYKHVLSSPVFQSALGSSENALQLITILKKVCNDPRLLAISPAKDPEKTGLAPEIAASIPSNLLKNASASSKLRVLDELLSTIKRTTDEKVVLISNFTSTLDILGQLLTASSMPFLRLDGSTPTSKRQELVDTFNRTDSSRYFAFMLSAKAGGMGLNLIGASRLILFDVDWNPAIDAQAMARIHRDGQKRQCHIYRLLLAGALDEKIWQRQVTKLGLASSVLESKAGQASFSKEELKDLFRLDEEVRCQTHELIGCPCQGNKHAEADSITEGEAAADGDDQPEKELIEISDADGSAFSDSEEDIKPQFKRGKTTESSKKSSLVDDKPRLMKSSELDIELQERLIRERREAARRGTLDAGKELNSLMAYSHVDSAVLRAADDETADDLIADEVLKEVVRDEDNLISFIFSKTTS